MGESMYFFLAVQKKLKNSEGHMKKMKTLLLVNMLLLSLLATGCRRNSAAVWDDTKSAGRHVNRGLRTLGGKHGDSRQINSRGEFMGDMASVQADDYIPLSDDPNANDFAMADMVSRQPRETPGDPGSSVPGIEAFQDPSTNPELARVFRRVYFDYNSSLIKGQDSLEVIHDVANYMKQHPNTYAFVEGHCDERGPEAYNLALGSHRSNAVRNMLINEGVSPDNIFTISYGKERPIITGLGEDSWRQNRRAEFRVYQR